MFASTHSLHEHNKEERHFTCSDCRSNCGFMNEHSLEQHRRTHLPKTFTCPVPDCAVQCASRTDVVLHIYAKPHSSMTYADFDSYVINTPLRRFVVPGSRLYRTRDGRYQGASRIASADIILGREVTTPRDVDPCNRYPV